MESLNKLWNHFFGEAVKPEGKSVACCSSDGGPKMWWEATHVDYDRVEFTAQSEIINYLINDPSTPELVIQRYAIPEPPSTPRYTVSGTDVPATKAQSLNVYATISRSLGYFQRIISSARQPIAGWIARNPLPVVTRAGRDWNAFYDRNSLQFFYNTDPVTRNIVFTCNSSDVVSHELGHAMLDALRPDFWNVQNVEIWAFHETFGDISAMLTIMQSDEAINRALRETGNDLSRSNTISRLAEEMGLGLYHATGGRSGSLGYLRDASVRFDYIPPTALPGNAPQNQLSNEAHSFSRVFSGAWYDMFVRIYKKELMKGNSPLESVHTARDVAANYFIRAVISVPKSVVFFNAMAKAIVAEDRAAGSPYATEVSGTFSDRKIYTPISMLGAEEVKPHKTVVMKLSDHVVVNQGISHNPIYDMEIEVSADDGEDNEVINAATLAASLLYSSNDYNHPSSRWECRDGKLVRRHVCRWH